MELDYTGLTSAIVNQLKDVLEDVHVSDEPEAPTTEQCPAVIVLPRKARRTAMRIVSLYLAGAPEDVDMTFQLLCWAFSAQSARDASRQRDELTNQVVDALRSNPRLNEFPGVTWLEATDIEFQWLPSGSGGSFFAMAALSVVVHAQA